MKVTRIPLQERLERIENGYAGDEKYDMAVIIRLANSSIADYLAAFPLDYEELLQCLQIGEEEARHMTYQDVARCVAECYGSRNSRGRAVTALNILMLPFDHCYEERRQNHE